MKFKKIMVGMGLALSVLAVSSCKVADSGNSSSTQVSTSSTSSSSSNSSASTSSTNEVVASTSESTAEASTSTAVSSSTSTPSSVESSSSSENASSSSSSTTTSSSKITSSSSSSTTTSSSKITSSSSSSTTSKTTTTSSSKTSTTTIPVVTKSNLEIIEAAGDQETVYAKFFGIEGASSYHAYVKGSSDSAYKKIDDELIRKYKNGSTAYYRVDAVGLKADTYSLKIVPVIGTVETADTNKIGVVDNLTAVAYERTGFTFSASSPLKGDMPGAYKADGTLKDNAQIIYLTESNKKTVKANIGGVDCTGIAEITQNYKKSTKPLCIRILGKVSYKDTVCTDLTKWYAMGVKGSIEKKQGTVGITFEGIGDDATMFGGGIGLNDVQSAEIRNIGFLDWGQGNSDSDAISLQGSVGIWIHDNDVFYGNGNGGDADQAKGDGSCDLKDDSQYVTVSYNHFWDSGKMSLCGMKSESGENYITYHHNWFDHSDSRHPRVRTMTVHVYNNYYDGNSKYGIGLVKGAQCFAEGNYFRNCKYPVMIGGFATDAAGEGTFSGEVNGFCKMYNNHIEGASSLMYANAAAGVAGSTKAGTATNSDAYLASSRDEVISSTYTNGVAYSNFDTTKDLGVTAAQVQSPEDAKDTVTLYAGRVSGGDIEFTFKASDDTSYITDKTLKALVQNYSSNLLEVQGIGDVAGGESGTGESGSGESGTGESGSGESGTGGTAIEGAQVLTFPTSTGDNSAFTVSSGNLKSGIDAKTYEGVEYKTALKMENATSIKFNASTSVTIKIVTDTPSKGIYIDGKKVTTDSNGIATATVTLTEAKQIEIKKGDSMNVYVVFVTA